MDPPLWIHHSKESLVLEFGSCSLTLHTPEQKGVEAPHIQTNFGLAFRPGTDTLGKVLHWKGLGCLGVATVNAEHYVAIVTKSTPILPRASSEAVTGALESVAVISEIRFFSLGHPNRSPDATAHNHPCHRLHRLLTSGQSYISLDPAYDLTARLKPFEPHVPSARDALLSAPQNKDFVANHAWLKPFAAFRARMTMEEQNAYDKCRVGTVMLHGFVGLRELSFAGEPCTLAVISRRAFEREGTHYAERGIDSQGYCAGYAETETLLLFPDRRASFVQVRGSVPVFWTERGSLGAQPLIDLAQMDVDAAQDALQKHFRRLIDKYGGVIKCLDLLDPVQYPAECDLSTAFKFAVEELTAPDIVPDDLRGKVTYQTFNLSQAIHNSSLPLAETALRKTVTSDVEKGGMTVVATAGAGGGQVETLERQSIIFRTNCRDCLDRTNLAQDQISLIAVNKFAMSAHTPQFEDCQALEKAHRALFADNGDALSRILTDAPAEYTTYLRTGQVRRSDHVANGMTGLRRRCNWEFEDAHRERAFEELEAEDKAFSLTRS